MFSGCPFVGWFCNIFFLSCLLAPCQPSQGLSSSSFGLVAGQGRGQTLTPVGALSRPVGGELVPIGALPIGDSV